MERGVRRISADGAACAAPGACGLHRSGDSL